MYHCSFFRFAYVFIAALFMLCNVLFTGCDKCTTDPILLYASGQVTSYGIFKPGTIWIYRNDSTGALDSVEVTGYEYTIDTLYESCNGKETVINYREHFLSYSTSLANGKVYVSSVTVGPYLEVAEAGGLPDTLYSSGSCVDTGYCNLLDTFRVFRKKYADVYERIDSSSSLYYGQLVRFYSSPGYGLIRREIRLSDNTWETWSLVSAVIVQ